MIRALIAAMAMLVAALPAQDGEEPYEVTLAWNPNPEPDVIGYRLHWGFSSGRYQTSLNVGGVTRYTLSLPWPEDGQIFYTVVTAYNSAGLESFPSNEIYFAPGLPRKPTNLRVETL